MTAFWRFLPDAPVPDAEAIRRAGETGKGALARVLLEARARLGAHRASALLRKAGQNGAFGRPVRVALAAAFQPRAVEDALCLAFAIAGLDPEPTLIDGFAAFETADLSGVDLAVLPVLGEAGLDGVLRLARDQTARSGIPVLVLVASPNDSDPPAHGPQGSPSHGDVDGVTLVRVPVSGRPVDERFRASFGDLPTAEAADALCEVAAGFAAALKGTAPKLLVTDLDGTLWSGTLGEAGAAPIALHHAYAEALATLGARGLVLAVASRNDARDVERIFDAHPEWPLDRAGFAALAVGWDDKAALVADCLAQLSLGPEHMVFVDDDPVNCARVAARFPQSDVRLFGADPDAFGASLLAGVSVGGTSGDDGRRAAQYERRAAVERLRRDTPDVGAFLRALDTRLRVMPLEPALHARAAELAARVNQFATTDLRPGAAEIARRASPLDFMLRLDDAFGSHGLVGLVLARPIGGDIEVEGVFLSCRALGRGVEDAMLVTLASLARDHGLGRIRGRIETLPRNEPARRYFSSYAGADDASSWSLRVDTQPIDPPEGVTLSWPKAQT